MDTPRVVAIVQARMGSSRLPLKVMADIGGMPLIGHVLGRASRAKQVSKVLLATSNEASNDVLEKYCTEHGFACERGSESDVLDRFYQAAKKHGADVVVRLTGDCPLVDPEIIDTVVNAYFSEAADYAANNIVYSFPDGLDVEVFSMSALAHAWTNASQPSDREHVTPFIRNSPQFKKTSVTSGGEGLSELRWTVDEPRDLDMIRELYHRTLDRKGAHFGWRDIMQTTVDEPRLQKLNASAVSNEGFYRSLLADERVEPRELNLKRSQEFLSRAWELIPSASQTFSKGPTQFVQGVAPAFLEKASGSSVWDVDGNRFIDYSMGLGPVILGHGYARVVDAVCAQVRQGTSFSLPHPIEVEVAEQLRKVIPCAEMVRYGKNGSDVTSGAVRVARAFTGRSRIACCGYHGWQDWYIGTTTRNGGVPEEVQKLTSTFKYNDLESLERVLNSHRGEFAAVILEPVTSTPPEGGFLEGVKRLAHDHGALVIFDEMITGFRWALGGAQEFFGVVPDLACFGKAIGNGFPIAAVAGRRDVMQVFDQIFFSFTFGGEASSLAAAHATISELKEKPVFQHTWQQGKRLQDGFNTLAKELGLADRVRCLGYPCRSVIDFVGQDSDVLLMKSLFQQECVRRGVLFVGFHNISYSHSNADIDFTLRVYLSALEKLKGSLLRGTLAGDVQGTPVSAVFRKV